MARTGRPPIPRTIPEPPPIPGARWVPLTCGKFAKVDEADFERVSQHRWCVSEAGRARPLLYAVSWIDKRRTYLHHFILGITGVDHRNGDGLDDRRENLRPATARQNHQNSVVRADSKTGFKGVSFDKRGFYRAWIGIGGSKKKHLGCFKDPKDAARAYNTAAKSLHGEFARLNAEV